MSISHSIESALKQYGLTREQAAIYIFLISRGDQTPFNISKSTRIPRTTVYRLLEDLRNVGIVTIFKKNNVAYYSAENPRRLVERLKEKEAAMVNILPSIDSLIKNAGGVPHVKLYTGDNGPRAGLDVLYDYLEKYNIKQLYTYSNSEISRHLPKYLNTIIERREKLKIRVNMIAPYQEKLSQDAHAKHYKSNDYREVRFLPESFSFEGTVIIGGDMAVFFSLEDNQIHTVVLESESIVAMLKQFFMFSWSVLKEN